MRVRPLLPDVQSLRCEEVTYDADLVVIEVCSTSVDATCPLCQTSSSRIHSRYHRKLADLPWHGARVQIKWRSRRFFCGNTSCLRRIFTERLSTVAASHGRKTTRLQWALSCVAFACGGEPGARLCQRLAMITSGDSLLRLIRRSAPFAPPTPRVLGVDDWAFRRGRYYGTILCDLERRQVVDLLPQRTAPALADWLGAHPGVTVISRDRADDYVRGPTQGAPQALQLPIDGA